jgi:hypothetical protein
MSGEPVGTRVSDPVDRILTLDELKDTNEMLSNHHDLKATTLALPILQMNMNNKLLALSKHLTMKQRLY